MAHSILTAMLFFTGFTLPMSFVNLATFGGFGITPNKLTTAGLLLMALVLGVVERRAMPRNPKGWWVIVLALSMLIGTVITLAQPRGSRRCGIRSSRAAGPTDSPGRPQRRRTGAGRPLHQLHQHHNHRGPEYLR